MMVALLAGATGLIGKQLLELLIQDAYYSKVIAVTRKPLAMESPKLQNIVVDFDRLHEVAADLKADDVFCCLGTTMKKAGSKEAFFKVDHDYPVALAQLTHQKGAKQFLLVSALGASRNSSFYYNEVKAQVEDAIGAIPFQTYHIFRPSLLLGPRTEQRPGEDAAKTFYKLFNFIIPAKYKGIDSIKVARAMCSLAKENRRGKFIHLSEELQAF